MHIIAPPNDLYAYMPGIMGRSDGKRYASAGVFAYGDMNTASEPIIKEATLVAAMICRFIPGCMRRKRIECPMAAMIPHHRKAR